MKGIAIILMVLAFGCDGGECGQAGPDECWPGPGKCWMNGDADGHRSGICCDDQCGCAVAEQYGPNHPIMVSVESAYGCAAAWEIGAYECDEDCNCTYPEDGDGEIIDLPR